MRRFSTLVGLIALATACRGPDISVQPWNNAPSVAIHAPATGAEFVFGMPAEFVGVVNDDSGLASLNVSWTSSIDGLLAENDDIDEAGNVSFTIADLSPGPHVITLGASDTDGNFGEDDVTINVIQIREEPSIYIDRPAGGEKGAEGYPFRFAVTVDDAQDDVRDLIVVMSEDNGDGTYDQICAINPDSNGQGWCDATLLFGTHSLLFEVTDTDSNKSSASTMFEIVSALDHDGDGDGYTENQGDCNDTQATIYPGAPEVCDGMDGDCNAATPIDKGTECYDNDGDGYSAVDGDCNDTVGVGVQQTPGKPETPDHIDNDCDGTVDEGTVFYDDDWDGYCEQPPCENATSTQRDCNDGDVTISPAGFESCDGADNDCDGTVDEKDAIGCSPYFLDGDGDGYGARGGASQCLCAADSTYRAHNQDDCYDSNAQAHPGQAGFFTLHRGDNKFDYNCDVAEEKQYRQVAGPCSWIAAFGLGWCSIDATGWAYGGEPLCGNTGFWADDCDSSLNLSCAACTFAVDPLSCLAMCGSGSTTTCAAVGRSLVQGCR